MRHHETGTIPRKKKASASEPVGDTQQRHCLPAMLLIGAAGRNSGKTLLATELIRSYKEQGKIIGAKVTTVHENRGPCPRGREGCGICSSLSEPFRLVEEKGEFEGKDTTRLLAAGADPVFWLCSRAGHLGDATQALLQRLDDKTPVVCESNSLRGVVEPGLFAILQREGVSRIKRSCRKVWSLADVIVRFDGNRLDPPPSDFTFVHGRWAVRRKATAVVLAGGQSSRMGRDKTLLPLAGHTMIEHVVAQLKPHFSQILISTNSPEKHNFLGLEMVSDRVPGLGPMMAITSALERAHFPYVFFIACDVPTLSTQLMYRLLREARSGADIVVPITKESQYEPLFAVYHRRLAPKIDEALERGERQIFSIYKDFDTRTLQIGESETLMNVNTITDYEALLERTS